MCTKKIEFALNLGNDLKKAKISIPEEFPVSIAFDLSKPIGVAKIKSRDNQTDNSYIVECSINSEFENCIVENFPSFFELRPAGRIVNKKEKSIMEFDLQSVSIAVKTNKTN